MKLNTLPLAIKNILIAIALVFTTGILASQTKKGNMQLTLTALAPNILTDRKDLASGD